MGSIDDLPTRSTTHVLDDRATQAFTNAIIDVGAMLVQQVDRKDYGTDVQLEVAVGEGASNVRVHVQIKGTDSAANRDNSVSVGVERTNLNYLLAQPCSFYVCLHAPTGRLLARLADDVHADYERRGTAWLTQKTVTVRFREPFDRAFQERIAALAVSGGRIARDRRLLWSASPPERLTELIRTAPPAIEVPASAAQAKVLLHRLYDEGRDAVISSSFEAFRVALGSNRQQMTVVGMADINVAMNGGFVPEARLRGAIALMEAARKRKVVEPGPSHYNEGNGWLALKDYERAIASFDAAIKLVAKENPALAAQCHKNKGSALEALDRDAEARDAYEESLRCDSNLAEARYTLGHWFARHGDYDKALANFDLVVRGRRTAVKPASVQGWRAYCLLHSGRIVEGLRLVLDVAGHAHEHTWIWRWCASAVAQFGAVDAESLTLSLAFWRHFLAEHPDNAAASFAQVKCASALHRLDPVRAEGAGFTFERFSNEATALMARDGTVGVVARLWDWIGHWAEREGNWVAAAAAYGEANKRDTAAYGYCLGVALLHLERYDEALEVLLPQAQTHQPDALSWAQVALARDKTGDIPGAIDAYKRALENEPNYALGWFNLGGMYFNHRDFENAESTWTQALTQFPDHELAAEAKKILKSLVVRRVARSLAQSEK